MSPRAPIKIEFLVKQRTMLVLKQMDCLAKEIDPRYFLQKEKTIQFLKFIVNNTFSSLHSITYFHLTFFIITKFIFYFNTFFFSLIFTCHFLILHLFSFFSFAHQFCLATKLIYIRILHTFAYTAVLLQFNRKKIGINFCFYLPSFHRMRYLNVSQQLITSMLLLRWRQDALVI